MSIEDTEHAMRLKQEVESYLKGAEPSASDLAQAPLLQGWRAVVVRLTMTDDPRRLLIMVLAGRVFGHPHLDDEKTIHTSQLIWLDRHHNWARSWNRIYRLGERASAEPDTRE